MQRAGFRVVGFDCAEEEHVAVVLDDDGEVEQRVKVVNRRDRIQECLARLILALGEDATPVIVVESKRAHGRLVVEEAGRLGCQVMQVNTVALNHFRDLEGQPRKDDEWDAFLAARMAYLRLRGCRELVEVTDEERALCRLTRSYARLTRGPDAARRCVFVRYCSRWRRRYCTVRGRGRSRTAGR